MRCTREHYEIEDETATVCGAPAAVLVTITGADVVKNPSRSEIAIPTPWNMDRAPRCEPCARSDRAIVEHLYPPTATVVATPIDRAAP